MSSILLSGLVRKNRVFRRFTHIPFCTAVVIILVASFHCHAQLTQVARYERDHKPSNSGWTVISLKENGLAMVRDNEKFRDGKRVFEMILVDTALQEKSVLEIELESRMILAGYEYSPTGYIDLLFREGEHEQGEMLLIEYDLKTGEYIKFPIKSQFNFKVTHFTAAGGNAVFGGYVNREPAVIIYDKGVKQTKVVPGFFTSDTELLDLRVNQNGTFNTLIINRSTVPGKTLVLRTFDKTGTQLLEDQIPLDQNKTILSALTSSLVRDEMLIAGTYAIGHSKQASGFFSVLVDPFNEQPVNYYDFPKLGHFLGYLNPRRSEKIRTVSERQRENGKDPDFRANVSNVRLEEYPDGFFMLAEVYSTTSGTNTMYPYQNNYTGTYMTPYGYNYFSPYSSRYYNSPYNYGQPASSSVRVLQSAVVVFNEDGKLDWDHSIKIDNEERAALEQASDFWCDKNRIVIANKMESELTTKVRYRNNEEASDTVRIMLKNEQEVLKDETKDEGGVRFWYGNKFFVWGYQTLKDPALNILEDRNRTVFYIVKVDAH
jgi:hypothetical protein